MAKAVKKTLSEKAVLKLEAQIPQIAALATRLAYEKAKSSGQTVVLSRNGFIVAEHANGTEQIVGVCKPSHKVKFGAVFKVGSGALTSARI